MSNIIIYDSSGRIIRTVSAPPDMLIMQIQPGEFGLIGDADLQLDYIDQGAVVPRPTMTINLDKLIIQADGVDVISISGAPPDSEFTAKNLDTREVVTGPISGNDTFATSITGRIELRIRKWPFLDWSTVVEAV